MTRAIGANLNKNVTSFLCVKNNFFMLLKIIMSFLIFNFLIFQFLNFQKKLLSVVRSLLTFSYLCIQNKFYHVSSFLHKRT